MATIVSPVCPPLTNAGSAVAGKCTHLAGTPLARAATTR
jgi:hypothetical protein